MPFNTGNSAGTIIVMVLALLLIFFAAHYTTKLLARKTQGLAKGKYMRVKDSMYVSRDKSVMMLEVCGRYYVVGATGQAFTLIGSLEEEELLLLEEEKKQAGGAPAGGSFFARATDFVKKAASAPQTFQQQRQAAASKRALDKSIPRDQKRPQEDTAAASVIAAAQRGDKGKAAKDERDEIEIMLQAIHQRKGRLGNRGGKDGQP